jgi:Recombinase
MDNKGICKQLALRVQLETKSHVFDAINSSGFQIRTAQITPICGNYVCQLRAAIARIPGRSRQSSGRGQRLAGRRRIGGQPGLRKTAEQVLDAQRFLADSGHSTGGDAPYGFVRVLVDAAGNEIEVLTPGRRVRAPGCHVRWRAHDPDKLQVWLLILDLKHREWGAKRIARYLNDLGIPSSSAGRTRRDHGTTHLVSSKWNARTVLELCRNHTILGLKEYGRRSEGRHRRLAPDGHRRRAAGA